MDEKKETTKEKKELTKEERAARRWADVYDWIQSLMAALIFCVVLFSFFVRLIDVNGPSMNPTLYEGDKLLVSDLFYKPKAGDVVIFKTDNYDPEKALVKRIVATEGQEINIDFENGIVYVDGQPLEESYVAEPIHSKLDFIGPKTVPEGCVFVLGDNRNSSRDSRYSMIGMVDERMILGRAYAVVYPFNVIRWVK
ncbi:MAG: signal peptidase I [Oscillospiraceae bacterium]|nr:signal peptidase I [Oscillospiraceae bacterium]